MLEMRKKKMPCNKQINAVDKQVMEKDRSEGKRGSNESKIEEVEV